MVSSMAPPSDATNNVHSGLVNTRIATPTLATINSPWKRAKLDRLGALPAVRLITRQTTATGCGDLTTNHIIALSVRVAYKRLIRVDAGATRPISLIPFPEMSPQRRRRRRTDGRGQRMHTAYQDRRRERRSPRIGRLWETQQTSSQHIHIALNLLGNWKFQRMRQGEFMEQARKGTSG